MPKMTIQINNLNMRYDSGEMVGAQVYFSFFNDDRGITGAGDVDFSKDEYESNFKLSDMQNLVRTKVAEQFTGTASTEEPTT